MRGLGDFQRAQMRDTDPRVGEFFGHLRRALDALEQIMLRPHRPTKEPKEIEAIEKSVPAPSIPAGDAKMSYSVKEVCKLVGISPATLYLIFGRKELRAVKLGNRTLILAKDLQKWLEKLPPAR